MIVLRTCGDSCRRALRRRHLRPRLPALREGIDAHFSKASVAAILSSLESESRGAYAPWARETANLMRSRSPTLLSVTLRQLQRGASYETG